MNVELEPLARGDLFSAPARDGAPRNLTRTSNAHERDAVWSPDGKWIAYNSDITGENELYICSQDGKGEPQQLTKGADTYYYRATWSPDSKKLLWPDRLQRLRYVDVASKAITEVDQDKYGEIEVFNWSPDVRFGLDVLDTYDVQRLRDLRFGVRRRFDGARLGGGAKLF